MRIHDIAFYVFIFFLIGIFLQNIGLDISVIIFGIAILAVLIFLRGYLGAAESFRKFALLSALSLLIIPAALYSAIQKNYETRFLKIDFGKRTTFSGIVSDYPERGAGQKLKIDLQPPYSGKISVNLRAYPQFNYGDLIEFEGIIKKPSPEKYAHYLAKDGVFGISAFPKTNLISQNNGSAFISFLFSFKEKIISVFNQSLTQEKSAFLAGITLGERAEFSQELKEAMSKSGTTHLVALSGYNISILVWTIGILLGLFLPRKFTFIVSVILIFIFVLTTGAEASVVRAAIMGSVVLLGRQIGRIYSPRNAVTAAAFFMVLANPRILNFDTGFQLSFLALLGIVYLAPAIQKFFRLKNEPGFLSWRENLLNTFSAQLAVAPLLIANFGVFSLSAFISNLLILGFIPLTMALGFILGIAGFISHNIAVILGWLINLLLSYELLIIKIFGSITLGEIKSLNWPLFTIYYLILIAFISKSRRLGHFI